MSRRAIRAQRLDAVQRKRDTYLEDGEQPLPDWPDSEHPDQADDDALPLRSGVPIDPRSPWPHPGAEA